MNFFFCLWGAVLIIMKTQKFKVVVFIVYGVFCLKYIKIIFSEFFLTKQTSTS